MSLSSPIITVLAHFQPLFTAPTWKKGVTLLIGMLLARGRRTVTAALRQMGHQMDGQVQPISSGAQPRSLVVVGSESAPVASLGQQLCHSRWERRDRH
jgi:hypothetical protein